VATCYDRNKSDFLGWLGCADFFIDDNAENLAAALKPRLRTLLYPQPWNRASHTVDDVLRTLTEAAVAN
jgi:hypothetical protein